MITDENAPPLYDLVSDPSETHAVAAAHADVLATLHTSYEAFMASDMRPIAQGTQRVTDDASERAMCKLGYTEGEDGDH